MANCYLLSEGFVSQIAIITNLVVVSSVGIKRVDCTSTCTGTSGCSGGAKVSCILRHRESN